MDLLMFGLVAMGFGAYSTYLLATSLPEEVLDAAAKHCRFAGVGGDTVHEDDTRLAINRLSERKASCLPTCPAKKTSSGHFLRRKRARANYKDAQYAPGDHEATISVSARSPSTHSTKCYEVRRRPLSVPRTLRDALRRTNPAAHCLGNSCSGHRSAP